MRPCFGLFSSQRWYEWYQVSPLYQHPTQWRFIVFGYFRGTINLNIPSITAYTAGYGVFDWDSAANEYRLTRFTQASTEYGLFWGSTLNWVDDTTIRMHKNDTANPVYVGKMTVASNGVITFIEPIETNCGSYAISTPSVGYYAATVGYNGAIISPYINSSGTPASNFYLGKVTASNSNVNSSALRAGLSSAAENFSVGRLGAGAGNGYAVGVMKVGSDSSSIYTGLFNVGVATPALVDTTTDAGNYTNAAALLQIGARKSVILTDKQSISGSCAVYYTDHDTAPTTITKGGSVTMPAAPVNPGDVLSSYILPGFFSAINCWVSEGKAIVPIAYNMTTILPGESSPRWYVAIAKLTSTGTSDLAISLLTDDINGNPLPVDTWYNGDGHAIGNYGFQVVGGPDDKASLFWHIGATTSMEQTVVQL